VFKAQLSRLSAATVTAAKKTKSLVKALLLARFRIPYYLVLHDFVHSRWAHLCLERQWEHRSGGRPHGLPAALVVSITSYPPRFGILSLTLRSLLVQTVKADRTILWIAHEDIPLLPKNVIDLQAAGLEIRATDDKRSYKKIIPALDAFPDAFICTADDDVYYWSTWLEQLVEGLVREETRAAERVVVCHRAHEVKFDAQGCFQPYKQWPQDVFRSEKSKTLFPTGMGGVLYPPGILAHSAEDREAAFTLCPDNDDIWLYWIGRRNGATYKIVGRSRGFVMWQSQDQALWHSNMVLGGNDVQIHKMAARYGYPAAF
jgi:hypothetical protein